MRPCPCEAAGPPCAEYWKAAVIFRGRVEQIQTATATAHFPLGARIVTFSVFEAFTGDEGRARVDVQTAGAPAGCGYRFASGREYLVYATRAGDGTLITGSCSRTRAIGRAAEDLAYIRNVIGGVVLGSVRTSVALRTRDLATGRDAVRPVANAAVIRSPKVEAGIH